MSSRDRVSPPSARSVAQRRAEVGGHGPAEQRDRRGDALDHRADQVRPGGGEAEAEERPAGVRAPVRRAEPGQRGHERDAAGVRRAARRSRSAAESIESPRSASQRMAAPAV